MRLFWLLSACLQVVMIGQIADWAGQAARSGNRTDHLCLVVVCAFMILTCAHTFVVAVSRDDRTPS